MTIYEKIAEAVFRKPNFKKFLKPVEPVENKQGIFYLSDGSLGYIAELGGINVEDNNPEQISNKLENIFIVLPEKYSYQLLLLCNKGCDEIKRYAESGVFKIEEVKKYMQRKVQWHDHGVERAFSREDGMIFSPRTIKTFITIKENGRFTRSKEDIQKAIEEFSMDVKRVESSFKAVMNIKPLQADDLIQVLYRFLNQKRAIKVPPQKYMDEDMRKYLIYSSVDNTSKIKIDNTVYNVISFGHLPVKYNDEDKKSYTEPNAILKENERGVSIIDYSESLLLVINFRIINSYMYTKKLEGKRTMAHKHRYNILSDTEAIDKQKQLDDTQMMISELYTGKKAISASIHAIIPTDSEEADSKTEEMLMYFNTMLNCNAFKEDLIASEIFVMSLPFGYDAKIHRDDIVQRNVICTSSNLADIAPLYRYGRGSTSETGAIYYNKRGELFTLDLFAKDTSDTAPHCLITGLTGSGKTVTAFDFIEQSLRQPAIVVIIDKEISYRRQCLLNGGQHMVFEGIPNVKMDPFWGDLSEDHKAKTIDNLSIMATGNKDITVEDKSYISEAVAHVFKVLKERGYSKDFSPMGETIKYLTDMNDDKAKSIARRLYMYHGDGPYSRFIEGDRPPLDINSNFVLFELADIDAYKDLQTVTISLLLHYITEFVKKHPGIKKYLIIDEAWQLFMNETSVEYLIKAVKTFRKLGCAVIFVTQQLDDFSYIAKAMNMKKNCPNKILLYQDYKEIQENAEALGLTTEQLLQYRKIKKYGKFSEALIVTEKWTATGRITLDPRSYWMIANSQNDRMYIDRMLEKGLSLEEAIERASKEYPYGVPDNAVLVE